MKPTLRAKSTQSSPTAMKPIAVVILNWNGASMLRRFLPDVVANTDSELADIIVADNGSDDDSLELLRANFPCVRVIELDENYGFAEGYNKAIREVDNPYVVLLNSDASPAPGWLAPMYDYMAAHADVAVVQPKILSVDNPSRFEYAGASGGFLDRNGYPYCRGRIFDLVEEDRGQYDDIVDIHWASGAAMMIRRRAYIEAGGLDAGFIAHQEEIDLCWRLRLTGWRIAVVPQSVVYHLGGGTLSADDPRKTYLNFRNNLLMMAKNLPQSGRRRKLIWRRMLDALAFLKYLGELKYGHAYAIIKAHRDFSKMRKETESQSVVKEQTNGLKREPNIIFDYFIMHRRRYSQLGRERTKTER